jgi:hypothetical protein
MGEATVFETSAATPPNVNSNKKLLDLFVVVDILRFIYIHSIKSFIKSSYKT